MKAKTMRRALFMSVISLMLCVSMLIGTTFAWFTDEVVSGNNVIAAGNLDIELEYWDAAAKEWVDVEGKSNILANDLWEPGHVDVAYLRMKNAGSLALKYELGVNIAKETAGVNQKGETFKLSDYIYFDVIEDINGETNPYATRADALKVATEESKISYGYTKVGALEAGSEYVYAALILHMPTDVDNTANHNGKDIPQIDLGIKAFASQQTSESDSFDNSYDGEAFVPVAKVTNLGAQTVSLADGENMDLDASFSFQTTENEIAAAASGYRYWHADFVVYADALVKANSVALAGYYDAFAQATNTVDQWIALTSDADIAKGDQIRLLEYMGVSGNYEELCHWIPEFLCGVADLDGSNEGTTLTVELRLYETYSKEECEELFGYSSVNEETGNYIVIGIYNHTFGGNYEELPDGAMLFHKDNGEVVLHDVQNVETADYAVPEGVTTIGGYAFAGNDDIESITLPASVTTLKDRAFRDTAASKVILNEGLENISYQAFRNASNVESVEIPSTVKTISKEAFQNSGIKELTIPANVTTIEYGGLRDMKELETVTIHSAAMIPTYAFRACTNLKTVILTNPDVTFQSGGMIFTNKENGDGSAITVYVANETVKERLLAADTAAKDYGGYKIIVGSPINTQDALTDALSAASTGETVLLAGDFKATERITVPEGVTLDGNGHTITFEGASYHLVNLSNGSVVKNVTLNNYRVKAPATASSTFTLEDVTINFNRGNCTGIDVSGSGSGTAILKGVVVNGTTDEAHLDPATQTQADYSPYGDVLIGGSWSFDATDCQFGSLHGWNSRNGSYVSLNNVTYKVFRMHYIPARTLYINGVETAWSESGAIPVAHDVGGCWSVQPAFR